MCWTLTFNQNINKTTLQKILNMCILGSCTPILSIEFRHERRRVKYIALKFFVFLRWVAWAKGIPRCIDAKTEADLPQDVRFDNEKRSDFEHSLHYAYVVHTHAFISTSAGLHCDLKQTKLCLSSVCWSCL